MINEATRDQFAWDRLAVLTDTIGDRLSGSPQLDRAIAWAVAEMKRDVLAQLVSPESRFNSELKARLRTRFNLPLPAVNPTNAPTTPKP